MANFLIVPLAQRRDLQAAAADLIARIWDDYYSPGGSGNAARDIAERTRTSGLPTGLIAVDRMDRVIGSGTLSGPSHGSQKGETPWITGLCTAPDQRGQGVATALVLALEAVARHQGHVQLHATTIGAAGLLRRLGYGELRRLCDDKGDWSVLRKGLD